MNPNSKFIFRCLDGLNTVWEMIAKDVIGNVVIEQIDYRYSDGRFTVATYGSGIYHP